VLTSASGRKRKRGREGEKKGRRKKKGKGGEREALTNDVTS